MTWRNLSTLLWGCAVVIVDALLLKPAYRYINRRSMK